MKLFDYLMNNPHRLPEVHVMLRNGVTSAKDGAIYCSGNCFECATTNTGCWSMKKGQQVIFKEHQSKQVGLLVTLYVTQKQ